MKLVRFGPFEREKPGILLNEIVYDVSNYVEDYDDYKKMKANGEI